jgi:hypothetical protein
MLYAGQTESVTLLKRNDDQQEGTVRAITLFDCRRSMITKTGQAINQDTTSEMRTIWHIPSLELERNGVNWINPLDQIRDNQNRYWEPESTTEIIVRLFSTQVDVQCLRIDPPEVQVLTGQTNIPKPAV